MPTPAKNPRYWLPPLIVVPDAIPVPPATPTVWAPPLSVALVTMPVAMAVPAESTSCVPPELIVVLVARPVESTNSIAPLLTVVRVADPAGAGIDDAAPGAVAAEHGNAAEKDCRLVRCRNRAAVDDRPAKGRDAFDKEVGAARGDPAAVGDAASKDREVLNYDAGLGGRDRATVDDIGREDRVIMVVNIDTHVGEDPAAVDDASSGALAGEQRHARHVDTGRPGHCAAIDDIAGEGRDLLDADAVVAVCDDSTAVADDAGKDRAAIHLDAEADSGNGTGIGNVADEAGHIGERECTGRSRQNLAAVGNAAAEGTDVEDVDCRTPGRKRAARRIYHAAGEIRDVGKEERVIAFDEAAVADAPREGLYQDGSAAGGAAADPDSYGAAGDGSGIADAARKGADRDRGICRGLAADHDASLARNPPRIADAAGEYRHRDRCPAEERIGPHEDTVLTPCRDCAAVGDAAARRRRAQPWNEALSKRPRMSRVIVSEIPHRAALAARFRASRGFQERNYEATLTR